MLKPDGSRLSYAFDGLGSTRALTDSNQNITDTYSYEAFGNTLTRSGTTENPYEYVGMLGYYADGETGLMLLGPRCYDANMGRFTTSDPALSEENYYMYADANPTNNVDPSGLITVGKCCPTGNVTPAIIDMRRRVKDIPKCRAALQLLCGNLDFLNTVGTGPTVICSDTGPCANPILGGYYACGEEIIICRVCTRPIGPTPGDPGTGCTILHEIAHWCVVKRKGLPCTVDPYGRGEGYWLEDVCDCREFPPFPR